MRHYSRKDWLKFRSEVIELDGGVCVRCRRGPSDGAILQVHHKEYLPGKLPWEYPYGSCETLCKGCHAGEHAIVRPFTGWECVGHDDLEEPTGTCELCGMSIRYVFMVQHARWPSLEVGEICCDHLTDTMVASNYMDSVRRYESRRLRFIQSPRWKVGEGGRLQIRQKGTGLIVEPAGPEFRLRVNGISGKRTYSDVDEAKRSIFELLENGELEAFLRKWTDTAPSSNT